MRLSDGLKVCLNNEFKDHPYSNSTRICVCCYTMDDKFVASFSLETKEETHKLYDMIIGGELQTLSDICHQVVIMANKEEQ